MDLKTRAAPPTDDERAAVESVLGPAPDRELHDVLGGHRNKARSLIGLAIKEVRQGIRFAN